jgi:hypothetical protein
MQRHIFGIGSGKYHFDRQTLDSFLEEAKSRTQAPLAGAGGWGAEHPGDQETQHVFDEIMSLYHDYQRCQHLDLLLKLKHRLEEFSIRYQSHVLAAEVLNINSCLPYEQRITWSEDKGRIRN